MKARTWWLFGFNVGMFVGGTIALTPSVILWWSR